VRLLLHNAGRLPIRGSNCARPAGQMAAAPHHQAALSLAAGERLELSYRLNTQARLLHARPAARVARDLLGLTEPGELRLAPHT
jgi:hypothetical protein